MWPWMCCPPSPRQIRSTIKQYKQKIKACKGNKIDLLVTLYKLWYARDQYNTTWSRIVCWWTLNANVMAGGLLCHNGYGYGDKICECDLKRLEEEFGRKVFPKAIKIAEDVLRVRNEDILRTRRDKEEAQKQEELRKLPDAIRSLDNNVYHLLRRVEALEVQQEAKKHSKKGKK